jgi:hypothetical protein
MYYIDVFSADDYDAVVRHLHGAGIAIKDRNKLKLFIAAELTEAQLEAIRELPLEEYPSIGTTALP